MLTAPDMRRRVQAIRKSGGKVVVLDPRLTETARRSDEHHFIRPGSDALLLAAILHVIFERGLANCARADSVAKNISGLIEAVRTCTPRFASAATGIAADEIVRMATEFATAESAVCYGRMGLSTQPHGGVAQWLVQALNLITGNLDRRGGLMFPEPAVSLVGRGSTRSRVARWHSKVRGLPEHDGQLPVAALAEEILTERDDRIRALVTHAGNPVLSTPNGRQLEKALAGLEYMVSIDIYLNETTRHADLILPPACGLETEGYDLVFNALAVRNVAKYSPALFEPAAGARLDWQILRELARRLQRPDKGPLSRLQALIDRGLARISTPRRLLNLGLALGPHASWRKAFRSGVSLRRLELHPHGIDLGPLRPRLPGVLRTADHKVDAAPEPLAKRLGEIIANSTDESLVTNGSATFALIGRRHLRSNNSWMHQCPTLAKGKRRCTLLMHQADARRLNLDDGTQVIVRSRVGQVQLPLEVTDDLLAGVVSMPHGFGHDRDGTRVSIAESSVGVSINDLTDELVLDALTGNAAFSGQRVTVQPAPQAS